jgi:type VI secretion system protein VasJ
VSNIDEHPLANLGGAVVSDASPCGENARYESDFEQLEAELAKQESLTAETVDWARVVDLATTILHGQSKDLLVGAYLCYGLLLREGYSGLAVGLKVISDMVDSHWECLFPPAKRMRARQTAFTWLAEKASVIVSEKIPAGSEAEDAIAAANMLRQLDGNLVDKMGDQAPMLTDLSRPLKGYKQSAEAELAKAQAAQPEPAPTATPEEPASPAPTPATAEASISAPAATAPPPPPPPQPAPAPAAPAPELASGSLASESDSKKAVRQIQGAVRDVAGFYLGQKLADARAYRLARMAVWMVVEKAPPENDGVTQVAPPAADRLKFLQGKIAKNEYAAAIPELEKTLARAPFWLDGHFYVAKSLRQLGAEYETAAQAVIAETANFLQRLPDIVELSFSDGTAFASDQTRMWLDAEVLVGGGTDSSAESGAGSAGEAWDSAFSEASKLAAGGDNDAALEIINSGLRQAGCQRDQVYWRCTLARLLVQTGHAAAASDLLEQISSQLDEDQVGAWEPGILALVYLLLYQAYQKQQSKSKEDPDIKGKADAAYRKLCWFDPVNALSVKGG